MYQVVSGGEVVALCDRPRYVKKKPETGAWIETGLDDAQALAVSGTLYNLPGGKAVKGAPVAEAYPVDGSEFIFQNRGGVARLGRTVAALEDAICELDAGVEEEVE